MNEISILYEVAPKFLFRSSRVTAIYSFMFGCTGSPLLYAGFLQLWQAGAALLCNMRASHCGGFSCHRVQALGTQASVVVALGP